MASQKVEKMKIDKITSKKAKAIEKAKRILIYSVDSVNNFYAIYQALRYGSRGASSHQEQDLTRAMLVFACSGLDAVIKQLVNDALWEIIQKDVNAEGAQREFENYVESRLKKGERDGYIDTKLLASILTSDNPKHELFVSLSSKLAGESLQSTDQLLKAASYFALTKEDVLKDMAGTKDAFKVRNEIIHEMDADFAQSAQGVKNRKSRKVVQMTKYSENIINVAVSFINSVAAKL